MRRTATALTVGLLAVTACGGSDDAAPSDSIADVPTSEESTPDSSEADTTEPEFEDVGPPPTSPDKPEVEIPPEAPTELVRTVLIEGQGEPAKSGDTLVVDYVGVRSSDGVEFDNSYDREPFPVTLGTGGVIQGWDDGLVGAQQGERVQLDIPSALAYGEGARGDIIGENENLTFVIDIRSVISIPAPTDVPSEPGVELSEGALETTFEDLIVGEGQPLEMGQTALIRYVNFRGDNGVAIETAWDDDPIQIPFSEQLRFTGLLVGMDGMNVGGRRAITIPPEDGFGPEGNPQGGLPANTDIIFVVELLGAY